MASPYLFREGRAHHTSDQQDLEHPVLAGEAHRREGDRRHDDRGEGHPGDRRDRDRGDGPGGDRGNRIESSVGRRASLLVVDQI